MNTKALKSKAKFFGNRRFASTRLGRNGFTLIELHTYDCSDQTPVSGFYEMN